jgi:hypothetical protein
MKSVVDGGQQMQELLLTKQYFDTFTKWMIEHVDPAARVKYPLEWLRICCADSGKTD